MFDHFFPYPSTETVIDKNQHAAKRRALAQPLSDQGLKELESSFLDNVEKFCSSLVDASGDASNESITWSQPRDVSKLTAYLSFDSMGDICFGQNFGMMEQPDNRYLLDVISDGVQGLVTVSPESVT